jgi:hypothetical protein
VFIDIIHCKHISNNSPRNCKWVHPFTTTFIQIISKHLPFYIPCWSITHSLTYFHSRTILLECVTVKLQAKNVVQQNISNWEGKHIKGK